MEEAPTLLFLRYDTHVICVSFLKIGMVGDQNDDHKPWKHGSRNNDPEAGQASISAVLFWEHNTPKLPNIQYVYWCTSTLHCQTPLWCSCFCLFRLLFLLMHRLLLQKKQNKNIRDPITGLRSNYRQLKSFIWYEQSLSNSKNQNISLTSFIEPVHDDFRPEYVYSLKPPHTQ